MSTYAGSWAHVESPQAARDAIAAGKAVVAAVDVALAPGVDWSRVAAIWCASASIESVNLAVSSARLAMAASRKPERPCLAYLDSLDAPVDGIDGRATAALNTYLHIGEPLDVGLARIRRNLERIPADRRLVLIWQSYDRRKSADDLGDTDHDKIAALQFWAARLAKADDRVIGILFFAHHRIGGSVDHPDRQLVQQAIADSTTPPPVETIGEPPVVERPRVTILSYGLKGSAPYTMTVILDVHGGPATAVTITIAGPDGYVRGLTPAPLLTERFELRIPGRYTLRASVVGPGGSDHTDPSSRVITVHPKEEEPMPGKPYDEQFYLNTAAPDAIADYAVMERPVDGEYGIWFTRTEHDYQNKPLTLKESWRIHRNEMRAKLNPAGDKLPQVPPDPQ